MTITSNASPNATSGSVRNGIFRLTLTTEIMVAADPDRVWAVLSDFPGYGTWNRAIPVIQGEAKAGAQLQVVIEWPGLSRGNYRLAVLEAKPSRELRWLGHLGFKGLMDGDHRFLIEGGREGRTKVIQTETFTGGLVPFFAPWLRDNVLRGFEQMNLALKGQVESAP